MRFFVLLLTLTSFTVEHHPEYKGPCNPPGEQCHHLGDTWTVHCDNGADGEFYKNPSRKEAADFCWGWDATNPNGLPQKYGIKIPFHKKPMATPACPDSKRCT